MNTSPQNVYAKCLPNHRGYPLWCPEPSSTLPTSYGQDGLQIGDVGFVNHEGTFNVLLNITHDSHHALHQRRLGASFAFNPIDLDIDREVNVQSNADPPGCVITSPGIIQDIQTSESFSLAILLKRWCLLADQMTGHYEFTINSDKGAILILHDGSTSHNLSASEHFRKLAVTHASDWYDAAKKDYGDSISNDSLYLITGFRKARSWSLASFHDPTGTGPRRIMVVPRQGEGVAAGRDWKCTFPVEYRDGPGPSHRSEHQTVFISGFKIAIRGDVFRWFTYEPEVHPVPAVWPRKRYFHFVRFLMRLLFKRNTSNRPQKASDSVKVDHVPALSLPFHPSDLINEYLLEKDHNALVAVTHDSEWMTLIESGEITLENIMQKDYLEEILSANYSLVSAHEDMSVYFTGQSRGVDNSAQIVVQQEPQFWSPKPPTKKHVVITYIRAEDFTVGLSRIPVGFYVLVQFDSTKRRTESKRVGLDDLTLEWDMHIPLPSEPSAKIWLSVCGSFEFSPILGEGETLCEVDIQVKDLLKGRHLITFSPKNREPAFFCSSIFIMAELRDFGQAAAAVDYDDNLPWEVSSKLTQETDQGHAALLRYREDPRNENITASIENFQRALNICPPGHQCRASALCNLALAHFNSYRVGGPPTSLSTSISYYREAHNLRDSDHPDRPGTLLRLAQALLYHSEKRVDEGNNLVEIMNLATEAQNICAPNSHERRAADLILQTCELHKVISSSSSADASKLIVALRQAVQDVPHNYFDRLQRLANLALALGSRYHLSGDSNDLNESITMYEKAMECIPRLLDSPFHLLPLREWTRLRLITGSWRDTLLVAASFMLPRFRIYQTICDHLETTNQITDAVACFHQLSDELTQEIDDKQARSWIEDFKSRCCAKLRDLGAGFMSAKQYDDAASQYTVALSLNSAGLQDLLIKRSEVYAEQGKLEDALSDANKAIELDPSSSLGYKRKYTVLISMKHYDEAADAFETTLSKMSESPDPDIRERSYYDIRAAEIKKAIRASVKNVIRDTPTVLINATSGRLCNKSEQAAAFEATSSFTSLVSMTTPIDPALIERAVEEFYRYAMLSHTWQSNEPLYEKVIKIVVYDLEASPAHDKLQMFCKIAREEGFHWAWSDTCCIDKVDPFVLQEALSNMFKWYKGSALTAIFLFDVDRLAGLDALIKSIWNSRAWTLQEYHASKVVRIYTKDWTPYLSINIQNYKESPEIISEMEKATGISAPALMALRPGLNDIREKLRLASTRKTTRVEDAAYSLLGIFSASMPARYGEEDKALGRLLSQLLTSSGDTSIIAWTGTSNSFNSCLPTNIAVFSQPLSSHIPPPITDAKTETVTLAISTSLDLDLVTRLYDALDGLPMPFFVGQRMKLPCLAFEVRNALAFRKGSEVVFRAQAGALGTVEIKTRLNLAKLRSLYLVHPWIDFLLQRRSSGSREELPLEQDLLDGTSLPPPFPSNAQTRVYEFLGRLKRPFGALMLVPNRRNAEYKRIVTEALITAQVEEITPAMLDALIQSVRVLDVL